MGRRARNRTAAEPGAAPAASKPPRPRTALNPARRTAAAYLGCAGLLGVVTLAAIAMIGGSIGPLLVFVVVTFAAFGIQRAFRGRFVELEFDDQDRLVQLLAAGLLGTCVGLTLVSALISIFAS